MVTCKTTVNDAELEMDSLLHSDVVVVGGIQVGSGLQDQAFALRYRVLQSGKVRLREEMEAKSLAT